MAVLDLGGPERGQRGQPSDGRPLTWSRRPARCPTLSRRRCRRLLGRAPGGRARPEPAHRARVRRRRRRPAGPRRRRAAPRPPTTSTCAPSGPGSARWPRPARPGPSVARRTAAAKSFTAWCRRRRLADGRPRAAARLGRSRSGRCPGVLRQDQAGELMDLAAVAADDGVAGRSARPRGPGAAVRQRHPGRRAGRSGRRRLRPGASGRPGAREGTQGADGSTRRAGSPSPRGVAATTAGPALVGGGQRPGDVRRGPRWPARPAGGPPPRARPARRRRRALRTSGRTGCGTPPPPICSRAARTCVRSRRCSATLRSRQRRSTPMSPSRG